jgi:hypothetical protein
MVTAEATVEPTDPSELSDAVAPETGTAPEAGPEVSAEEEIPSFAPVAEFAAEEEPTP